MSKYVHEVLNFSTLNLMFIQSDWDGEISSYLRANTSPFSYEMEVKYSKLFALDIFDNWDNAKVALYLNSKLINEFTKIYNALTYQYKPYFNYYRKISEKNSGADENQHTGNDTIKHTGSDKYSGNFHNDIDEKTVEPSESLILSSTYDEANKLQMKPQSKEETNYTIHRDDESGYDDTQTYGKIETQEYGKVLTMNFGRIVDTEIEGINGLTPPQDLIKKEIILRIHYRLFDIFSHMMMSCVSSGVWDCE